MNVNPKTCFKNHIYNMIYCFMTLTWSQCCLVAPDGLCSVLFLCFPQFTYFHLMSFLKKKVKNDPKQGCC